MNKNKIIFAIIGAILVILLIIWLLFMNSDKKTTKRKNESWSFEIWIVEDKKSDFESVLTHFKEENKSYANIQYNVTSFPNYEEYSNALNSAIIKWVTPDLFVLNNNETSLFEEKILAIPNDVINTNDFRKEYNSIFTNDLLIKSEETDDNWELKEYLKWLPVGYETLNVFYDRRLWFKSSDFSNFAKMKNAINRIKKWDLIPLAIWNWSATINPWDILAHFYLIKKVKSLASSNESKDKTALYEYTKYWSTQWLNGYNKLFTSVVSYWRSSIDLFRDEEVSAIVAYPRVLLKLQALGFSKKSLFAKPFPHLHSSDWPSLANYNYFVINKNTEQRNTAFAFLKYLNSDDWAKIYLNKYKYYSPAKIELSESLWERKISNYFESIALKDTYSQHELSSFDKWNKVMYDKEIVNVLDDFSSYMSSFEKFKKSLLCKSDKILNLTKLENSCE